MGLRVTPCPASRLTQHGRDSQKHIGAGDPHAWGRTLADLQIRKKEVSTSNWAAAAGSLQKVRWVQLPPKTGEGVSPCPVS